jgi:hypothetical protein
MVVQFAGHKIWAEGITSDLVDLTDNCNYKFDVSNKVATIQPNQNCAFASGDSETPSSWRFSLLAASTAEEVATTTLDGTTCLFTASSTLSKISKN